MPSWGMVDHSVSLAILGFFTKLDGPCRTCLNFNCRLFLLRFLPRQPVTGEGEEILNGKLYIGEIMSIWGIPMECNRKVYMGPISIVSASTGAGSLAIMLLLPHRAHHQISLYGAYLCVVIWKLVWYQPIGDFCGGGVPGSSRRKADTSFLLPNNHAFDAPLHHITSCTIPPE